MAAHPQPERGSNTAASAAWLGLQRRFQIGLAERAQALLATAERTAELHGLLHRLVGAAGAYGDQALAEAARQLMHALPAAPEDLLAADARLELQALCGLCVQRAEQAANTRPPEP